jgi:hypothetical protein
MQLTHFVSMVLKLASHAVGRSLLTPTVAQQVQAVPRLGASPTRLDRLVDIGECSDARRLQGDRRLEEQLATLLEARMEMDAEWAAAQAQATGPQQVGSDRCAIQPDVICETCTACCCRSPLPSSRTSLCFSCISRLTDAAAVCTPPM